MHWMSEALMHICRKKVKRNPRLRQPLYSHSATNFEGKVRVKKVDALGIAEPRVRDGFDAGRHTHMQQQVRRASGLRSSS